MTTETEKKMYDMKVASDALAKSTGGLESAMSSLASSKLLTVISRMASGVLPTFWQLQNKIRAGFTIIDQMYKRQGKATKEALEAMEELVNLSDMAKAMKPFDRLFAADFNNYIPHEADMEAFIDLYDDLTENMKGFDAIEMSIFGDVDKNKRSLEDMVELMETTQDLLQPQKDEMTKRQNAAEKAMQDKRDFKKLANDRGISDDTPFGKLRMKALRAEFKVNKALSKIKSTDWIGNIKGGAMFFGKAMLVFSGIIIGLTLLFKAIKLLEPVLRESFSEMREYLTSALTFIFNMLSIMGEGFADMYKGLMSGDVFLVLGGMLKVFIGGIMAGIGILILAAELTLGLMLSLLWNIFESILSGGREGLKTLSGVLIIAGLMLAALVFLGVIALSWPVVIVGAIVIGIGLVLDDFFVKLQNWFNDKFKLKIPKLELFSSGGVVNSNLQLVGERGPELVTLPRGSRVHSNADSKRMGGSGGNTIHVHVNGRVGASDAEIRDIANKVAREINLRMSRTGSGVNNF